jgi:hypothetical protein
MPKHERWKDATFRRFALGLWYKREKNTYNDLHHFELTEWAINIVNSWSVGVDLLVVKFWVTWDATGPRTRRASKQHSVHSNYLPLDEVKAKRKS